MITRVVPWIIAGALLVGAGVVVALEPSEQLAQGPFVVDVGIDEQGSGRNIEATIHDVRVAEQVELDTSEGWTGETEGVWVVADVTAQSILDSAGVQGFLLVGDYEFRGSERLDTDGLESAVLSPGIPVTGALVFEIPRDLLAQAHSARVMVGLSADWRLDSIIATTVDLSSLTVAASTPVSPVNRVAP